MHVFGNHRFKKLGGVVIQRRIEDFSEVWYNFDEHNLT